MPSLGQALLGRIKPLPPAPAPELATELLNNATLSSSNTTALVEKANSNEAVSAQSSEGAHSWSTNPEFRTRFILNKPETDVFVICTSQEKSQPQET